jgi:hypothetical protein
MGTFSILWALRVTIRRRDGRAIGYLQFLESRPSRTEEPGMTQQARDKVALILASSLGACLLLVTGTVMWVAVEGDRPLGEPGSHLLGVLLGGLLGVVGSYLGFKQGKDQA